MSKTIIVNTSTLMILADDEDCRMADVVTTTSGFGEINLLGLWDDLNRFFSKMSDSEDISLQRRGYASTIAMAISSTEEAKEVLMYLENRRGKE